MGIGKVVERKMKKKLKRMRKKKMERMECLKNENERYEGRKAMATTRKKGLGFHFFLFSNIGGQFRGIKIRV